MRLLAEKIAPTGYQTDLRNRFKDFTQEDVVLENSKEQQNSESLPLVSAVSDFSSGCSKARVDNLATDPGGKYDLLIVQGKINGRNAKMLIDSGSTHDFIAEEFVHRYNIPTEPEPGMLQVTLADGSTNSRPMISTTDLKTVVEGTSETQNFTVFPLSRYDAILGMPWLTKYNPKINFQTNEVVLMGQPVLSSSETSVDQTPQLGENLFISGRQARHALRSGANGYIAWLTVDDESCTGEAELPCILPEDMKDLLKRHCDVFPDKLPDHLPPKRSVDHEINVEQESQPPSRPAYRLSKPELDELQVQLTEMLRCGRIEPSKSPYGAPVFFVKKANGGLRLVCDWRQLNRITIKNKACLPNIDDLFDTVQGSRFFTKLDLRSGYNQIRIQEHDVPKTAINTPFGHFQYRVMGFGLTNAPATFQSLMNTILQPYLRQFVVVFLDDILIFSKSWQEHLEHVQRVLQTLRENQLFCNSTKCEFGLEDVLFLGHRINGQSISPDPAKIEAVKSWPTLSSVTEVRQFLGFTNYFRRFISHYSSISAPLEEITGKHAKFEWTDARQKAFESLRSALINSPVLRLADVKRSFRVETDASDFAVAGVLLQEADDQLWHPVAYTSRKLSAAERNYTAGERETLAVVFALKCWRIYLFDHFQLFTDNMAVVHLRTKPTLTQREARWVEFLADFNFTVHHQPGSQNVADALSRRPDHCGKADNISDKIVTDTASSPQVNAIEYALETHPELARSISAGYRSDKELAPIIERLKKTAQDNLHERYYWDEQSGHLYLRAMPNNRLCIPKGKERLLLLQECHDCITAGHPGRDRTYFRLARLFYWPRMGIDVKRFVRSCDVCQRTKRGQSRSGLLQSLPVPSQPWADISMDFIMGLPETPNGHNAVYTFVDRLTKCVHLIPTVSTIDAKGSANLYIQNVFRLHGLSSSIVCDRDTRFTSTFFQELFEQLGTKLSFSTANHPQTDGSTERMNRLVEDILRAFVNHRQNNWDSLLPLCEFAINSSQQASTGHTPFFLNYGLNPRAPMDLLSPDTNRNRTSDWLQDRAEAIEVAQDAIVAAQARQAFYADLGRVPSDLEVGDQVMVFRDFLLTPEARNQPAPKLRPKWFGPFPVTEKVGANAYRLKLPHILRCHPVFNVSALRRYTQNSFPGRTQPPPPPVTDLDGHSRYIVERVLAHRTHNRQLQYLVKWTGYTDATWEPASYLQDESGRDIVQLQQYKSAL